MAEGMLHRHLLSTGMAAFPANCDGVPFDMSHIYASGNIAADMYCNVAAESTGRVLATRLYNATNDPGMRDMWSFLIARDTMHQQQWLAVIEELGGHAGTLPIPNSFPQEKENQKFNYNFFATAADGSPPPPAAGRTVRPSTARASSASSRTSRWARSRSSVRRVRTAGPRPSRSGDGVAPRCAIVSSRSGSPIRIGTGADETGRGAER